MNKIILSISALLLTAASVKSQVYVGPGATHYMDADQMIGTTYATDRSTNPGWFIAKGNAVFNSPAPDDGHNINGYMEHIPDAANQNYTFPVGSGTDLRTLTIGGTVSSDATVGTAWIAGNPSSVPDPTNGNSMHDVHSVGSGILSVSSAGQWDWVDMGPSGISAQGATITVSIPDLSATGVAASDLRLVGWDGSEWINLSSSGASGVTENSTLSGVLPASVIQAIGIGSITGALPVTLSQPLKATLQGCKVKLSWASGVETNFDHFTLSTSTDGKDYSKVIDKETAKGNGSSYSFIQADPANGVNYYKLSGTDKDGTTKDYSIVTINVAGCAVADFKVYPNPTFGQATINGTQSGDVLKVYNSIGQTVSAQTAKGSLSRIDLSRDVSGVYFVMVIRNNIIIQKIKIIKR